MHLKKEELLEYSRSIIDLEQKSRVMYEDYLRTIEDKEVRETLKGILKDEIGHIEMANLLALVLKE